MPRSPMPASFPRALLPLYWIYQWLIFIPIAATATGLFAAWALVLATLASPSVASAWAGRPWARFVAALTPARVRVEGQVEEGVSYVIVANHLSLFDVFVLYGWLGIDFRWVMKQEIRRIPAVGIACERIGHIFIDRSDSRSAVASLERAKKHLKAGTSLVFFPEGTRGPGHRLLPFKKGAFRVAAELGLPVLPVSIVGSNGILPARGVHFRPGTATLIFHPPVDPPDADEQDLRAYINGVRDTIAAPVVGRAPERG